jgi:hypothetical protein
MDEHLRTLHDSGGVEDVATVRDALDLVVGVQLVSVAVRKE